MELAAGQVKMISARRVITAGPITAEKLGVPVGTVIADEEIRSYADPAEQAAWDERQGS